MAGSPREPFFTSQLFRDPYPIYSRLRAETRAHLDYTTGELVLTRYADVAAALRHPQLSSRRVAEAGLVLPGLLRKLAEPVVRALSRQMLFSDPPDHTRLRALGNKAFTPRAIEALRSNIQGNTDTLLDRLPRQGSFDLVHGLATRLPILVIAEMLGVRTGDRGRFKTWSDDIALFIGGTTLPKWLVLARAARGMFFLRRYFQRVIRERRGQPGEDLLGALIAAEERGDQLTEEELIANCVLILAAGHETTTNLIGNGMLALLRNPDQLDLLRREPELVGSAVEELLRYESPVQWTGRVAVADIEVSGIPMRTGQRVAICLGAANRDPEQFPDPDRLDLRRADNRHVAFSQGIHFCLGAALARMEGQIAITSLLRRYPKLRLGSERLEWHPNFTLRGLKRLPLEG